MKQSSKITFHNQAGFSLVELMIAVLIGLIATLVITQTMSVFEGQKRGTTGTSDAQTNGNIGLFYLSRDIKQAGYGLMPLGVTGAADSAFDCTTVNLNTSGITSINPITITEGASSAGVNASDTIVVRYGTAELAGAMPRLTGNPVANSPVGVETTLGCRNGDVALIRNGATCNMTKLAAANAVNAGSAVTSANVGTQTLTFIDGVGASGNDFACLGTWNEITYQVVNGNLQRNGVDIVPDVVNIQAQYGVSLSASSNQINKWVNASATADADGVAWSAPTTNQRKRIKAVRIAIIARNPHMESANVTNACSSTSAASPSGLCSWAGILANASTTDTITTDSPAPAIDLSPADANWARYHYSVYESIVPLRNIIWAKDTL